MKGNLSSARRVLAGLRDGDHLVDQSYDGACGSLDVGCGIGCWALAASEIGYEAFGMDGDYVPRDKLLIPADRFSPTNLEHSILSGTTHGYDLVTCMEVAEHLSPQRAESFARELGELTVGVLLFSAAIPGQGGERHINERWQSYWADLLGKYLTPGTYKDLMDDSGVATDVRPMFWGDPDVAWWYQQNMMVFYRSWRTGVGQTLGRRADMVHPTLYAMRAGVAIP